MHKGLRIRESFSPESINSTSHYLSFPDFKGFEGRKTSWGLPASDLCYCSYGSVLCNILSLSVVFLLEILSCRNKVMDILVELVSWRS